ncbi:hypothetical protein OQI89_08770 [Lentilactobacillus diolivorans]|uniref:hypothetical protein n=1 Tax=Lentilactobacillus diolivorans TaxID=179838 RepID=UPI00246895AD|nr:hypothetical protein [Lentilactobacillus diolivorans]MDH5105941.1 hypothetical protein [Lentilactobacillus diolivorans]
MTKTIMDWKSSLNSPEAFNSFITNYFNSHKELIGHYENSSYYEFYTVHLDDLNQLTVTFTTGVNQTNAAVTPSPYKDIEKISVEQFRQLILNKKFAEKNASLADAFKIIAGVPEK